MRTTIAPPLLLALLLGAAACGGDDPSGPEPPASLAVVSGTPQQGAVGAPLAAPLVVRVLDDDGDPVAGIPVAFAVTGGGGAVGSAVAVSGADGLAQSTWTLGAALGAQSAEARIAVGAATLTAAFTATAALPADAVVDAVAGDGATFQAGTPGAQLTARLRTAGGAPIRGATVRFTWPAGFPVTVPEPTTTDDGLAPTFWGLPRTAGTYVLAAKADGVADSATFTVTVTPAAPARVAAVGVAGYNLPPGATPPEPFRARVTDSYGNAVQGATVEWVRLLGTGSVSPAPAVTGADGIAATSWQPSTTLGYTLLEARIQGVAPDLPTYFQVSVLPGPIASFTLTPPAMTVPLSVGDGFVVEARAFDAYGNPTFDFFTPGPVTWSSSNPSVASVDFPDQDPPNVFSTAIYVHGTGTAVIRVTAPSGAFGEMTITVTP